MCVERKGEKEGGWREKGSEGGNVSAKGCKKEGVGSTRMGLKMKERA